MMRRIGKERFVLRWAEPKSRRLGIGERGAALIEIAFVLPVFVLLLVGVIDFGRYAYTGILIANGARAGVQYGALNNDTFADTIGMQTAAADDAQNLAAAVATNFCYCASAVGTKVDCSSSTVCATPDHRLTYVQVDMSGTFTPWIAYPGFPASITIDRKATMQVSP